MKNTIKNLLQHVKLLNKKYDDIAKLTGANFNIFQTLGLSTNEVRTHSAFIGELLNSNGSHDMGDVFLKEFLEVINIKDSLDFKAENSTTEIEKHIGYITDNRDEGGQIDIIITDNENNAIIIENKIYASDQHNQLLRYYNYGEKMHKNKFCLLYLTLDNKKATNTSLGHLTENDYKTISYSETIISWLERCKEKAVEHSTLRETITQYINLIKHLTNQTMSNKKKNEIVEIMGADANTIKACFEIRNNLNSAKILIIENLANDIKDYLDKETNYKIEVKMTPNNNANGFIFYKKTWKENAGIWFELEGVKLYYSIKTSEAVTGNAELQHQITKFFNIEKDNHNPFGHAHICDHWKYNYKIYDEIFDGSLAKIIRDEIKKILEYLDNDREIEKMLLSKK